MDQRTLIQHGTTSLTLCLPMKWLKERGLKKGDSVYVHEDGNKLEISSEQGKSFEKAVIDVSKLDWLSIVSHIHCFYKLGYNEIEIQFSSPTTIHYRTGEKISMSEIAPWILRKFIGYEVIEQSEKHILVKQISKDSPEELEGTIRRLLILTKDTFNTFLNAVNAKDEKTIANLEHTHLDPAQRFSLYAIRLLSKYGAKSNEETLTLLHILAHIEDIMNTLKFLSRDIPAAGMKYSEKMILQFAKTSEAIQLFCNLFYNLTNKELVKMQMLRYEVKNDLFDNLNSYSKPEILHLSKIVEILNNLSCMIEWRIGIK